MKKYQYITNGILYQITWFLCIFYPDKFYAWIAAAITLSTHLHFQKERLREFIIIIIAALMGYSMDQLMDFLNLLDTSAKSNSSTYLLIIWIVFACTFRSSFKFILKTYQRSLGLGLIAPVSYFLAQKIGVVKYSDPLYLAIISHMFLYSSLMSFFYLVNKKIGETNE